eukprot:gene6897-7624_t
MFSYGLIVVITGILCLSHLLLAVEHEATVKTYRLPEIKYNDLFTLEVSAANAAIKALTEVGGLQVTDIPRFALARKRALEDLAECYEQENAATELQMPDGSRRVSCGAVSHRGVAQPMSHVCGEAANKLRAAVDATTRQLFLAFDLVANQKNNKDTASNLHVMEPSYETYSELMSEGEHIEHLHTYFSGTTESIAQSTSLATMNFHKDTGLMIAMTTGYYSPLPASDKSGLYIELVDGSHAKVEVEDDALIILMGEGAVKWLKPVSSKPFRAPLHALLADLPPNGKTSRSWYGKMYLPPADAIIPQEGMTFTQYHQLESRHSALLSTSTHQSERKLYELLPTACGGDSHKYIPVVSDVCDSDEIWCWAQCMSAASLSCGSDAVCWDSKNHEVMDGDDMCMNDPSDMSTGYCYPACLSDVEVSNSSSSSNRYCKGEGTSMYMQGFISIAKEGEGNFACVNWLFPEWTLDTRVKMAFGCLGAFLMCVFIQYLSVVRLELNKWPDDYYRLTAHTVLYAIHVTLGYFAMLLTMTYSAELFCMVCAGLTVGYLLFQARSPMAAKSSEPCCEGLLDAEQNKTHNKKLSCNDGEHGCCCDEGPPMETCCCDGGGGDDVELAGTHAKI